jgi:uncharacterized membrane protein YedE/YeeE
MQRLKKKEMDANKIDKNEYEPVATGNPEVCVKKEVCQKNETLSWILKYTISTIIGFLFGYAMEKSKVYEPKAIRQQMIFQKFIMIKMFLTALTISTLSVFIIALVFKKIYEPLFKSGKDALNNKPVLTLIVSGMLIGVGMQISGSCPGMVLVQLGAGVPYAYITLIGALSGALIHGLLNSKISKDAKAESFISKGVFEIIPVHPIITRLFVVVLLAITVFLLEFFIPYSNEYSNPIPTDSTNIFIYKAWPPFGKYSKFLC